MATVERWQRGCTCSDCGRSSLGSSTDKPALLRGAVTAMCYASRRPSRPHASDRAAGITFPATGSHWLMLPGLLPQTAMIRQTKGDFPFPWVYRPLKCFTFQELGASGGSCGF